MYLGENTEFLPASNIKLERICSNVGRYWPFWVIWTFDLVFANKNLETRMVERSQGRDCCTVCFRSNNFCLENRGLSVLKNTFLFCKWEEIVNRYQLTHLIRVNCECDTDTASQALPFNLLSWKWFVLLAHCIVQYSDSTLRKLESRQCLLLVLPPSKSIVTLNLEAGMFHLSSNYLAF